MRAFKSAAGQPTTGRRVARTPFGLRSCKRSGSSPVGFHGERGTGKLEFAIITAVTAVLISVALTRLNEVGVEGRKASEQFKQSQERAASALEQAACATASASKQSPACGVEKRSK
ncbi:hypothetical protein [Pelomonas sp. SE-A7]|uniref:hypothetical protein n=1 Tax=Pelomonas sp. SE-A7 TaxID=3054953 RepID=UPI00259D27D3|nr:hypothetical protein [Pelomonas sp. SE-A7]MDM4767786.1 hypothetical protein [Pelomonas sp. SE-A7]